MKSNQHPDQHSEEKTREELNSQEENETLKSAYDENAGPDSAGSEQPPVKTDEENAEQNEDARLAEKEKAFTDLTDKYMRLAAEYDNFRRRSQKERESLYGEAVAEVVKAWLPVIDNLDRAEFVAEKYESKEAKKLAEGISMIQKQVNEVLEKLGVEEIDCCDKQFDPELHEAVMHIEDDNYGPSAIVDILRKGYRRNDRIIRHVMVKVAN